MAVQHIVLLVLHAVSLVISHPQCLNYEAPFIPEYPLKFCTLYSEFGCCSRKDDEAQRSKFDALEYAVPKSLWKKCSSYIKDFLCQTCSPYAAHVFNAEVAGGDGNVKVRYFPGICKEYCKKFFKDCKDIVQYFMPEDRKYKKERKKLLNKVQKRRPKKFCKFVELLDNDYCFPELLDNDVLNGNISIETVTKEGCLCVKEIAGGLRAPLFAVHAGDGSDRLFVGEQIGSIRIVHTNKTNTHMPVFMDMEDMVHVSKGFGDERGLLGMAFHPKFKTNGLFYICYTVASEVANHKTRLSEFSVSTSNPNKGNTSSERILLEIDQPYANHNGGMVFFGTDDYLYLTIGDGGKFGDPHYLSQNLSVLIGKILRIDVNTKASGKEYGIPPDNPYSSGDGGRPEIYTYGMRNTWRCGVDPGKRTNTREGRGRIICGDVGQGKYEELDLIVKGGNYGWSGLEGESCYKGKAKQCEAVLEDELLEKPIWVYDHVEGKCVIGGHFYRGCMSPNLDGHYFYGDLMTGKLYKLTLEDGIWKSVQVNMCGADKCVYPEQSSYNVFIYSFGQDEQGEVYIVSSSKRSINEKTGGIFQIIDPHRRGDPEACGDL